MPQIFDVTANENTRYKCDELEYEVAVEFITTCIFLLWLG